MFSFIKISLINLLTLVLFVKCYDNLIVNTSYGKLQGRLFKSRDGRTVNAFHGIPFAEPPIGKLRFQDPHLPKPWSGIRYAMNYGSVCVQMPVLLPFTENTTLGNEDCLYLSVYSPNLNPKKPLPVMVNFHGGGFFQGSGEVDRSADFFMDHDIVMVLPNYRLTVLGFLSMEDDILPGNMGLKDQSMALIWVRDNIANFGGDPNQITIFGESAGGSSTHFHMYSPMSKDLFHKAISQSGTIHAPWAIALPGKSRHWAIKMAELFNCPTHNSQVIYDCLILVNSYDLVKAVYTKFASFKRNPELLYQPISDMNAVTPFFPYEDPMTVEALPVPWMTGVVSLEGLLRSAAYVNYPEQLEEFDKNFYKIAPRQLAYNETSLHPDKISKAIRKFYFGEKSLTDSNQFQHLTDMLGDNWFIWPMVSALSKHKGVQYVYYINYLGEFTFQDLTFGKRLLTGTSHWDDSCYIWKTNNPVAIDPPSSPEDVKFSRLLVQVLVNFAIHGDPTPKGSNFCWPRWDDEHRKFASFEQHGVEIKEHFLDSRMRFWESLPLRDKLA